MNHKHLLNRFQDYVATNLVD